MKKIMKYILTASFAFLFCLLFAGGFGMKAEAAEETIYINTADDLAKYSSEFDGKDEKYTHTTFELTQNIDMSELSAEYQGKVIRYGSADKPFMGTFDGKGYTISNLKNEKSVLPDTDLGLFVWIEDATIKDLTLEDPVVDCAYRGGAVVGHAIDSTIENVRVHGGKLKIQPANNIVSLITNVGFSGGAIAGSIDGTTIYNCEVRGTEVVNNSTAGVAALGGEGLYMGGIVGSASNSVIEYCRVDDGLQINEEGDYEMVETTIRNEYDVAVGALGGKAVYAGGIAGEIKSGSKIIDSYSTADVYVYCGTYVSVGAGNVAYAGGVVAEMYGGSCTVTRCHYAGNIHTKQYNAFLVIPIIENDKYISGVAQYSESKEANSGIDSSFFQRSASKTTKKFYALNDEVDTDNYKALSDEEYRDRSFWIGEDYDLYGTTTRQTDGAKGTAVGEHVNRWVMDYKRGIPIHGNAVSAAIDFPGAGKVTIDGTELIKNSMEGYPAGTDCSVSTSDAYNFAIQGYDTYEDISIKTEATNVKDPENAYKFSGWYIHRDTLQDSVSLIKSEYEGLTDNYSSAKKVSNDNPYKTTDKGDFKLKDNDLYIAHYQANVTFHNVEGNVIDKDGQVETTPDLTDDYYNYQDTIPNVVPAEGPDGATFYAWTDVPSNDGGGYASITSDQLQILENGGNIYRTGDQITKPLKLYPIYTNYLSNVVTIMEGNDQDKNSNTYMRDYVGTTRADEDDRGVYIEIKGLDSANQKTADFQTGYRFLGWYEDGKRVSTEEKYYLDGVDLNEKHTYEARMEYLVEYWIDVSGTSNNLGTVEPDKMDGDWYQYGTLWKTYQSKFDDIAVNYSYNYSVEAWYSSKTFDSNTYCNGSTEIHDSLKVYGKEKKNTHVSPEYQYIITTDFPGAGAVKEEGSSWVKGDAKFTAEPEEKYNFKGWGYEEFRLLGGNYTNFIWQENSVFENQDIEPNRHHYLEAHYTADVTFNWMNGSEAQNSLVERGYHDPVLSESAITGSYTSPISEAQLSGEGVAYSRAASPTATEVEREGYYFLGWINTSALTEKSYIFDCGDNFTTSSARKAAAYLLDKDDLVEGPMEVNAVYAKTDIEYTTNIKEAGVPEEYGINLPTDPKGVLSQEDNGTITLEVTASDNEDHVKEGEDAKYQLQYVECITNPGDNQTVTRLTPDEPNGHVFTLKNFELGKSYKFIAYYEPLTVVYHLDDEDVHVDIRNSGQQLGESPEPQYDPAQIGSAGENYAFVGWTTNKPNSGDGHYYYLMASHDDQSVTLVQPTDVVNQSMELYPAYAKAGITVTTNIEKQISDKEDVRGLRRNADTGEFEIYAQENVTGTDGNKYIFTGWTRTPAGGDASNYSSESVAGVSDVFDGATYTAMYEEGYTVTYHYWNPDKEDGAGYDVLYSAGVKNGDKLVETIENTEPDGTIEEIRVPVHTEAFTGIMNTLAAGQTFEEWQTADGKGWDKISLQTITDDMDLYPVIWQTKVYDSSDEEMTQTASGNTPPQVYVQTDLTGEKTDENLNGDRNVSVYFDGMYSEDKLTVNVGKQSYTTGENAGKFVGVENISVSVYNQYELVEKPDGSGETEMTGDLMDSKLTDKQGDAVFTFAGKLEITKKLKSKENTGESFIFKVTKLDANGDEESTTDVIVEAGDTVTMSLPYGTYKVTEDDGWAWRYTPTYDTETKNPDGDVSEQNADVDAGDLGADSGMIYINSFESSVICTNKESNSKWFDSSFNVKNVFGKAQAGQDDQNNN